MNLINEITNEPKQKHTIRLDDGTTFTMKLEYKPLQLGWFITEFTYKTFLARNLRIVTSPNILRQYLHQLPFGLACFVTGNQEPTTLQDFDSGRAQLAVLTAADLTSLEGIISGQATA